MGTINATEARNEIGEVTVLSVGQIVAIVLSPAEFERLNGRRRGAKAGFAKHLFVGVDLNGLLDTSLNDVFEGYR